MKDKLSWGVIGTGGIATDFTEALGGSSRCRVVNVSGSSAAKSKVFAERWRLPKSSSSLQEMLEDPAVEAVYIATPHPLHEEQAIACIKARKHVLCEKPLTIDAASSERVIAAARSQEVFFMEALMYRCHPLMMALIERLKAGAIGRLRHVRADFGFRTPRDPKGRLFDLKLGGGGILDVGGYPVSFSRLIAGLVDGKPFSEPARVEAVGVVGPTGADEVTTAVLSFASGFSATVTCAIYHDVGTQVTIFGEEGKIILADPWVPGGDRQATSTGFTVFRDGRDPEQVTVGTDKATYAIEAEYVADMLPAVEAAWPAMSWADSLGNMKVLDAWRDALQRVNA